jgi:hypothetical protein
LVDGLATASSEAPEARVLVSLVLDAVLEWRVGQRLVFVFVFSNVSVR